LFWRLAGVLALFSLLVLSLQTDLGGHIRERHAYLSEPAKDLLREYGRQAEQAWKTHGASGVDAVLAELGEREQIWAAVVSGHDSLSSQALSDEERLRLNFVRRLDGGLGRPSGWPTLYIPFSDDSARLVMELPQRLNPRQYLGIWDLLLERVLPTCLAVLLGLMLYHLLIAPLVALRRQANALSNGDLSARCGPRVTRRRDELGELGRAFDQM